MQEPSWIAIARAEKTQPFQQWFQEPWHTAPSPPSFLFHCILGNGLTILCVQSELLGIRRRFNHPDA